MCFRETTLEEYKSPTLLSTPIDLEKTLLTNKDSSLKCETKASCREKEASDHVPSNMEVEASDSFSRCVGSIEPGAPPSGATSHMPLEAPLATLLLGHTNSIDPNIVQYAILVL